MAQLPAVVMILLFTVVCLSFLLLFEQQVSSKALRGVWANPAPPEACMKRRLADGCYHVFLDVGSNVGVHGRFLLEPDKYNETWAAVTLFEREFGKKRDNRDFCVFAFEPNPAHIERQKEISSAYKAMGWRYEPISAGVGDSDGNITFYHVNDKKANNEWGFTSRIIAGGTPEHVPVIRLASWLQKEVQNREIPVPFREYKYGPKVVMKMDVEGMEFIVLPDLLLSGALCSTIDYVFGEWHYPAVYYPMKFTENNFVLNTPEEAKPFGESMLKMIQTVRFCKTRYETVDDESYLFDGKPLPEPDVS